jgi:LacI family transcriptional regulator
MRVPDDVAVVGHADTTGAAYTMPALTTVRAPWAEAGRRAAELALLRIQDPDRAPVREDLPRRLVVRESCGAVAVLPAVAASGGAPARPDGPARRRPRRNPVAGGAGG